MNTKAKNRVLNNWPRTTVDTTEVFDKLYLFKNGVVQETPEHVELYKLMGMDVDELKAESYDGVDALWLYFKYYNIDAQAAYTDQQMLDYAQAVCADDITYTSIINMVDTYNLDDVMLGGADRDALALSRISAGYNPDNWTLIQNANNNPADFIALQDTSDLLFDRTITVSQTQIEEVVLNKIPKVVYTTSVKVTYKIKPIEILSYYDALWFDVRGGGYINDNFLGTVASTDGSGLYLAKASYYDYINGGTHNYDATSATPIDPVDNPSKYDWFLTTAGVAAMKAKDFGKLMQNAIESDYKEEEADWWAKILNFIIIIIAVVVVIMSGGTAAAGLSGLSALTAFATSAAMTLTIAMAAQMALAMAFQGAGMYGNAIFTGKSMVIVQSVAKVIGYIALFANMLNIMTQGFTKAIVNEAGKEIGRRVLTTGEISMQILSWLNQGLSEYTNYDQEKNMEEEAELQAAIDEQEELMMVAMTPKSKGLIQHNFESYAFLDSNEKMENIPYVLTEGRIEGATTKYYS